jgi:nicotinamidase/pyrazinamidase
MARIKSTSGESPRITALDAAGLGFQTTLIEDASRGVNLEQGDVQRAIGEMRQVGAAAG